MGAEPKEMTMSETTAQGFTLHDKTTISSSKVDNRKHKSYGREISVTRKVTGEDNHRQCFPSAEIRTEISKGFEALKEQLYNEAETLPAIEGLVLWGERKTAGAYVNFSHGSGMIGVRALVKADRPKEILTEEACLELLGEQALSRLIEQAFVAAMEEHGKFVRHQARIAQATNLLEHLTGEVVEKAKSITRYRQRLAALNAELEAEKEAQIPLVTRELLDAPTWDDTGERIDQRVIDAALAKLPFNVKGRGTNSGPFGRGTLNLQQDDVE